LEVEAILQNSGEDKATVFHGAHPRAEFRANRASMISTAPWREPRPGLRAYASNDEPLAAAGNKVCAGARRPIRHFILLYVAPFVAGTDGMPWLLMTLFVFPFFLMVPAISRRHPFLGRVLWPWPERSTRYSAPGLLGERSGTGLFLIPCATLASLAVRSGEASLDAAVGWRSRSAHISFCMETNGTPPYLYRDDAYAALFSMNAVSVGTLSIFLGIVFSGLYAGPATRT